MPETQSINHTRVNDISSTDATSSLTPADPKATHLYDNAMILGTIMQSFQQYVERFVDMVRKNQTTLGKVGSNSTPGTEKSYLNVTSIGNPGDSGNNDYH